MGRPGEAQARSPGAVTSMAAAPSSLPTRRLAARKAKGSAAPARGTPRARHADPAQVLHHRQQARCPDLHRVHGVGSQGRPGRRRRRSRGPATARSRTAVAGLERREGRGVGVEEREAGATQEVPAARGDLGIDAGEPTPERQRAGRHRGAGRRPPGDGGQGGREAVEVGEAGEEAHEGHREVGARAAARPPRRGSGRHGAATSSRSGPSNATGMSTRFGEVDVGGGRRASGPARRPWRRGRRPSGRRRPRRSGTRPRRPRPRLGAYGAGGQTPNRGPRPPSPYRPRARRPRTGAHGLRTRDHDTNGRERHPEAPRARRAPAGAMAAAPGVSPCTQIDDATRLRVVPSTAVT